jgi:hypothetical protein
VLPTADAAQQTDELANLSSIDLIAAKHVSGGINRAADRTQRFDLIL